MMLFLVLGPLLEEKYGSTDILFVIVSTALVTGIVNAIIGTAGLLGASGIVFAFIILASMTSFRKGEIPLTLILVAVLYIGKEIVNGISAQDNISQLAHIGGGLTGGLLGYYIASKKARIN
jgi:GlpG protein